MNIVFALNFINKTPVYGQTLVIMERLILKKGSGKNPMVDFGLDPHDPIYWYGLIVIQLIMCYLG